MQQVGKADDRVERRAQLVAHVGEELALQPVGLLHPPVVLLELLALAAQLLGAELLLLAQRLEPATLRDVVDDRDEQLGGIELGDHELDREQRAVRAQRLARAGVAAGGLAQRVAIELGDQRRDRAADLGGPAEQALGTGVPRRDLGRAGHHHHRVAAHALDQQAEPLLRGEQGLVATRQLGGALADPEVELVVGLAQRRLGPPDRLRGGLGARALGPAIAAERGDHRAEQQEHHEPPALLRVLEREDPARLDQEVVRGQAAGVDHEQRRPQPGEPRHEHRGDQHRAVGQRGAEPRICVPAGEQRDHDREHRPRVARPPAGISTSRARRRHAHASSILCIPPRSVPRLARRVRASRACGLP
ncbi:MAG: hypothetical protein ABIY55_15930 [Kofleriaceae bacterium]